MTIFGADVSSFQHGLNIAALPDPFILMKVTEGTYYVDADYPAFLAMARSSGKRPIAYHFVTTQDPDAQAAWIAAHIGDKALDLMLDVEPQAQTGSRPTVAQVAALIDRCLAHGLRPRLVYLPRWYWQELGSPSLAPLATRGQGLISSAYPGGSGYPGDGAAGWQPYGGMTPLLYQYTDAASEGGQRVGDMNAYRGTIGQLVAFLNGTTPTPSTPGGDVTPEEHNWVNNLYSAAFIGGPSCGRPVPAGASADIAGHNSMFAHLDYMTSLLENLAGRPVQQPIDPKALAAAIAPLLNAQATPEAIAQAVISHLSVTVGTK